MNLIKKCIKIKMNDRFGINLKNNESNLNPLNDPAQNVYAPPKYFYKDILTKNKKKYPNLHGNNMNFPDYLQINGLHDNEIYKLHAPKYIERRKYYPDPVYTSMSVPKGKRIILELNNRESKDTLNDNFYYKNDPPFLKKLNNGYNIINHRIRPAEYDSPMKNKYLSKLAELSLSIKKKDREWVLTSLNNNHRLNDGIYNYLKEHNYV